MVPGQRQATHFGITYGTRHLFLAMQGCRNPRSLRFLFSIRFSFFFFFCTTSFATRSRARIGVVPESPTAEPRIEQGMLPLIGAHSPGVVIVHRLGVWSGLLVVQCRQSLRDFREGFDGRVREQAAPISGGWDGGGELFPPPALHVLAVCRRPSQHLPPITARDARPSLAPFVGRTSKATGAQFLLRSVSRVLPSHADTAAMAAATVALFSFHLSLYKIFFIVASVGNT